MRKIDLTGQMYGFLQVEEKDPNKIGTYDTMEEAVEDKKEKKNILENMLTKKKLKL